jgi:hypothetical protein
MNGINTFLEKTIIPLIACAFVAWVFIKYFAPWFFDLLWGFIKFLLFISGFVVIGIIAIVIIWFMSNRE